MTLVAAFVIFLFLFVEACVARWRDQQLAKRIEKLEGRKR